MKLKKRKVNKKYSTKRIKPDLVLNDLKPV